MRTRAIRASWLAMLWPAAISLSMVGLAEPSVAAQTVYSYSSMSYNAAIGPYTTDMSMSIDITLESPLDADLVDFDALPDVVSFTFFDGVVTVTEADAPFAHLEFYVTTDAEGDIFDWAWAYRKQVGPTTENGAMSCGARGTLSIAVGECQALNFVQAPTDETDLQSAPGPGEARTDADVFGRGTWTVTTIPEPSTTLLIGMGLAGLALRVPGR